MNKILTAASLSLCITAAYATPPITDSAHQSASRLPIRLHDTPENRYVLEQVSLESASKTDGTHSDASDIFALGVPTDAATQIYDGAHIEFGKTTHDFGDVARRGGDITAEFEYVNDGTEPLVITHITASCTCLKPVFSKRPLEAGKRGVIKLVYEPHKMEAGAFHKVVQVHTNSTGGVRLLTVQGHSVNARKL